MRGSRSTFLRFVVEHAIEGRIESLKERTIGVEVFDSSSPMRKIPADYALAMRFRNPTTEQTVMVSAGIGESGTQAASEFLTTPEYFAEAIRNAPPDRRQKNMQALLSAKVMSGTAGPPRVLAVHFW